MRKIIIPAMLLACGSLLCLVSTGLYAATCKLDSAPSVLSINDSITLNPASSGTAGTVLWSKTYSVPSLKYSCDASAGSQWFSEYSRAYLTTAIDDVYATEISGIGIRVKWPSNASGAWLPGDSGTPTSCANGCSINNSTVLVEFVQTGRLSQGENYIPAGELAAANVVPTTDAGERLRIMTINLGTAIKVVTRSCAIYPSSNTIDLGTFSLASFTLDNAFQGDKKPFSITINCPTTEDIGITFSSVSKVPFGAVSGVIGAEEGEGYASNFSIRLFEKQRQISNALKINTEYPYTVTGTVVNNYEAQIYVPASINRANQLTAGKVVGAMQYTMVIK
ncbi:fimbrial protein [uncultured Enterobacter sp.]|uniref:fimbrial protein n=1 Tax=uncultured Enterobacter sp. TaxID=238202 RepID=UPI002613374B|nr:fimbrial protein [uncultured Enterobacter sp.]